MSREREGAGGKMCDIMEELCERRNRDAIIRIWDTNGCRDTEKIAYWFSKTVKEIEKIVGTERLKLQEGS